MGHDVDMRLRPFLSYYGAKWMHAARYPAPAHEVVIEPFAGSAGYSVRHFAKRVILYDISPDVVAAWRYLIATPADEIRSLPLLRPGEKVRDLPVCPEAGVVIGWWVNKGAMRPYQSLSAWARDDRHASQFWGEGIRERLASQVEYIRHWQVHESDYVNVDVSRPATWFVDPPYNNDAGRRYPYWSVDFDKLAAWCKSLPGQVIVCEQTGATWLPFEHLGECYSTRARSSGRRAHPEVLWTNVQSMG